ncbi:hypothetical protein [Niabella soli]|uniref:Uncharacterized protein n=1 Tax=Niabella soli DSM 19437 TaxID=929713 RepID=W0F1T3_9BACT|nr:hypothetical protein [Niabella soli]AHF17020.1 hypothetical protein NIASO_00430 [Niabella soli DSM 19437]
MDNSTAKSIGIFLQLIGAVTILWGIIAGNPAGAIGVLVALIGRVLAEKWDDWFN